MSWDAWNTEPQSNEDPTWGDYGKAVGSGVTGLASSAAAGLRYFYDQGNSPNAAELFKAVQGASDKAGNDITNSMTPEGRDRLAATFTSEKFWEHPISSTALKATNQLPMLAAAAIPGALVAEASAAVAMAAAAGGALSTADVISEIYKKTDAKTDDELKKASDYYAGLRATFDEKEARRQYNETLMGLKPALAFALGVGTGAFGPAANIVRGVKGEVRHGIARSMLEGAAGEAIEEGSADYSVQNAEIQGGLKKDIDKQALVDAALGGGVMGGLFGGASGIGAGKGKAKANEIKAKREATPPDLPAEPTITPEVKPEDVAPQTAQQSGTTGRPAAPVEAAPVGDKQNQPTRSETKYPKTKGRKGKAQGPVAEVVDAGEPSVAEKAAVGDLQQQAQPTPPPVPPSIIEPPLVREQGGVPPWEQTGPHADAEFARRRNGVTEKDIDEEIARTNGPTDGLPDNLRQYRDGLRYKIALERWKNGEAPPPIEAQPAVPPEPVTPVELRKPRVLQAIKDKATQEAEAKAAKAAADKIKENAGEAFEVDEKGNLKERVPVEGRKHWTKKEIADRAAAAENSRNIFDKYVPDNDNIPTDADGRARLRERLGTMLGEAEKLGIKIPIKNNDATPDHIFYLREAKDLYKKLGQKGFVGKRALDHVTRFMDGEIAAKGGDFSVMRGARKVEGELANARTAGNNIEKIADLAAAPHARAKPTVGSETKGGAPVHLDASEKKPAAAGRKLEGAEKAKAIAELNARMAKGKVDIAATRVEPVKEPTKEPATPPKATSDVVVTRAGKKTNTEPSEAQKEAGNYAKGTVDFHGLHFAIENPKGSVRKGDGWSTEMQDHYGYIKRTAGADGDQVDAFMGPNPKSEHVWVIHQQDFNGNFDEHKAMLGFNERSEAMQAYDRAFSDGRGYERIKDMESMSISEFKEWVKSDKPKKARKEDASIDSALKTDVRDKLGTNGTIDAIKTIKARDALKSLDLTHLSGVPKALAKVAQERFMALVGDTDVHIVNKYEMARATGDVKTAFVDSELDGTRGLATMKMTDGKTRILLRADQFKTPEATAHAVLHEVAHAATTRALVEDAALYNKVTRMMQETEAFLKDVPDIREKLAYALTDEREFIAEAFSNPKVQEILASVPLSDGLARELGLARRSTAWDAIVDTVRKAIQKITGSFPEGMRMVEGIMRLGPEFEAHINRVKARKVLGQDISVRPHEAFDTSEVSNKLVSEVKNFINERVKGEGIQEQAGVPKLLSWRSMDQLAQAAEPYFRGNNPIRRIADITEMMRVKASNLLRKSEPIVDKLYQLEKKYQGKVWDDFTALVHDETMSGVYADRDLASQTHLGKDVLGNYWAKEQHAGLAARFAELNRVAPDLIKARVEAIKYFTDTQNAMSLGIIKNRILKLMGVEDDELARRIHEGRTLDTDADLVGGSRALELIKEAKELAKIEGPYLPLMRRGTHVVRAEHDVAAPKGAKTATKISDNEYQFTDRNEVIAYEKQLAQEGFGKPTVRSRWVDKNTGDTKFPDGTKVTKSDTDAQQRWTVSVQNRHVEFFDNAHDAQRAAFELAQDPSVHVKGVEERKYEWDAHSDILSHQIQKLAEGLKHSDRFKEMGGKQRAEVLSELHQASLRFLGSTRIQSRRLPRRYVEGASKDLTRNTLEYAQSSSGYLAKLEHQPQLEEALKAMHEGVTADDHKTHSLGRSALANEVARRMAENDGFQEGNGWTAATKRIMTLSFLDKLAGPSHNIINSLQPAMVTMPTLAGRYGVGKSFDALSRAYRDVSGLGLIKAGLKDTLKKAKDGAAKTTDLIGDIKKNLSPREREMIDYLAERGSIDPDAGFEVERLIKSREGLGGKLDIGLGKFEAIARQMPQAIEMMNRSVTALATYRLEMGRGAAHEAAMRKAQETVNNTQGLYSASNSAPIFNHPVAKLSLQFKKYGQMMYHLIGTNIGKALKNAEPGDRAEALKTLAGITATHVAMAGALGLPTEPFKYLLMGAQAAGLTSTGWNDVEDKVRQHATNWFGKTGGEIFTKGLPRAVGVDLSSRVGLDSLSSFGEPKSNKDSDVKSWLFDTLAGAPVALVSDWVKGANALTSGDFVKAGELLVPMKFAADSIKAYRLSTEGKKGSTGKETMAPYSFREAATRMMGFTPAREAEEGAKRAAFYGAQKKDTTERSALMTAWVTAKPGDKSSAWKTIQSWNKDKPRDAQISMSDLSRAAARRRKEGDDIKTNKRDKRFLSAAEATYNS